MLVTQRHYEECGKKREKKKNSWRFLLLLLWCCVPPSSYFIFLVRVSWINRKRKKQEKKKKKKKKSESILLEMRIDIVFAYYPVVMVVVRGTHTTRHNKVKSCVWIKKGERNNYVVDDEMGHVVVLNWWEETLHCVLATTFTDYTTIRVYCVERE